MVVDFPWWGSGWTSQPPHCTHTESAARPIPNEIRLHQSMCVLYICLYLCHCVMKWTTNPRLITTFVKFLYKDKWIVECRGSGKPGQLGCMCSKLNLLNRQRYKISRHISWSKFKNKVRCSTNKVNNNNKKKKHQESTKNSQTPDKKIKKTNLSIADTLRS